MYEDCEPISGIPFPQFANVVMTRMFPYFRPNLVTPDAHAKNALDSDR